MVDQHPEADRILIAQLHGEAKHHARWRELSEAEETAAVAALRELAAGRGDLLARQFSGKATAACHSCYAEFVAGAAFCPDCGARVPAAVLPAAAQTVEA